jgi:hypothetical protein
MRIPVCESKGIHTPNAVVFFIEYMNLAQRFIRVALLSILFSAQGAQAQTAEDANKSNNPLNLAASFNVQNY